MTSPPPQYGLGRLVQFDDRSRAFPVRALLHPDQPLVTKRWYLPSIEIVLNQGETSSCVGHGITNDLRYTPLPILGLDSKFAVERIYWPAEMRDPFAGGDFPGAVPQTEGGTSVLAGMQTATEAGFYGEYRWGFGEHDLALAVGHVGPAIIGVPWLENMFQPDDDNTIHATGENAGGHCVCIVGINLRRNAYLACNSWGPDWGQNGKAWITRPDMARLLDEQGEAAIPTVRTRPPRP